MKYQFKEGDGSHRDMTIEECNLVIDRLRKQGHESYSSFPCDDVEPLFVFLGNEICRTNAKSLITNEIPFERWMEILDQNEREEFEVIDKRLIFNGNKPKTFNVSIGTGSIDNNNDFAKANIVFEHLPKELRQKAIISELKEVVAHIPEYQLAGFPEKMRKLVIELTKI